MHLGAIGKRAEADPDGMALSDGVVTLTWLQLASEIIAAVRAMRQAVVEPGERVGVTGDNSVVTMIAHTAGLLAGVGTVALSRKSTGAELAQRLTDSNCAALVTGTGSLRAAVDSAAASGCVPLRIVIVDGVSPEDLDDTVRDHTEVAASFTTWPEWLSSTIAGSYGGADPATVRPQPLLVYTSGTTGRARATEVQWQTIEPGMSAEDYASRIAERAGFPPGPHLVVGPLQHNGPLTSVRHLLSGQSVIVLPRFDAAELLAAIDRHRVASTVLVPTHFSRLLALPRTTRERFDVGSLTLVAHTGSACPAAVKRDMIDWFGPVLVESYGGSELGTVCKITSDQWLERPGSVGQAVPPLSIAAYDDGRELAAGETGMLGVTLPAGRQIRYLGDDEKSRNAYLAPGVVTLGDIGHVDASGFVYITDRAADVVVSGGVNLYPAEIEQVLVKHASVRDVAVIGVPDPDMGESLTALIVPSADVCDFDDLDAFCRRELEGAKCPRTYERVGELIRNEMGKLDKRALRRPYWPEGRTIAG